MSTVLLASHGVVAHRVRAAEDVQVQPRANLPECTDDVGVAQLNGLQHEVPPRLHEVALVCRCSLNGCVCIIYRRVHGASYLTDCACIPAAAMITTRGAAVRDQGTQVMAA